MTAGEHVMIEKCTTWCCLATSAAGSAVKWCCCLATKSWAGPCWGLWNDVLLLVSQREPALTHWTACSGRGWLCGSGSAVQPGLLGSLLCAGGGTGGLWLFFLKQIKKVKNYSSCFYLIASSIRSWHGKKSDLGHSTTASQQAVQISSTSKQKYF